MKKTKTGTPNQTPMKPKEKSARYRARKRIKCLKKTKI